MQYQIPVETLVAANALKSIDSIYVGQVLIIPLTSTVGMSVTFTITVTPSPVVRYIPAATATPTLVPGLVYPAPKPIRPANGATFKYDEREKSGVATITFEWTSVGQLQNGTQRCTWPNLPNGDTGYIWDRYQIEFTPPLINRAGKLQPIYNNDHGTYRSFSLLEFKPDVVYTWRVVVARWCMAKAAKTQGFLGIVSPYSTPFTFSYKM